MASSTPDIAAAFQAGIGALRAGELARARGLFQNVLSQEPTHFGSMHMLGVIFMHEGDIAGAAATIARAIEAGADNIADAAAAFANQGIVLRRLGQNAAALQSYNQALELDESLAEVWFNRGNLLRDMKLRQEALESFEQAIVHSPNHAEAHVNRGHLLRERKQYSAAIESFDKAIELRGGGDFLYGLRLHMKMQICDWRDYAAQAAALRGMIENGESATPPLPVLAVHDSPALQRKAAGIWVKDRAPPDSALGPLRPRARGDKIRVAYVSLDFRAHPVAYLTAELFEVHDRSRFEFYALSYGSPAKSEMRTRLEAAFDHFIDVHDKTDLEIAALSRALGIDIAIDLAGHTALARTGIFALRAAPIQINYIGYIGTMAAPYIDYIITDKTVIPDASLRYYTEIAIRLPCFQANDSSKPVPERIFSRAELGLPETGFVFCSFSNTYKVTPDTFDTWMRILKRTPGSVLLLNARDEETIVNVTKEAVSRGVEPSRMVFARRLPMREYLCRYRNADLFLDTWPYNAGATASDALWSGLPVLTRIGESFAGRMAASLLEAIGLPELITATPREYEDLAVALAMNPDRLRKIQNTLENNRRTAPLFDTKLFARNIEHAYVQVYDRFHAGNQT